MKRCKLRVGDLREKKLRYVFPAEMISLKIRPDLLDRFHGDTLRIDLVPLEEGEEGDA
jgi:hypothetical protein